MTRPTLRALALVATFPIAACAPDAWKPAPGYEGFLNQVQNACYYQRIGLVNVGDMLTNPGNTQANYFIDETSRLYFGKITPENWTSAVTAFMQGRSDDPGVKCTLEQLRQAKAAQAVTAPPAGPASVPPPPAR